MIAAAKNARGPSHQEFKCNHDGAFRDRLECFVNLESVPWVSLGDRLTIETPPLNRPLAVVHPEVRF